MNNQQAYNIWAESYDSVANKTRDLEAIALRSVLSNRVFSNVLEIGCGTGKNTEWLIAKSNHHIGVDFSPEMLRVAKEKFPVGEFKNFDITQRWDFPDEQFDLVACSLILEHMENIDYVFQQSHRVLRENGLFYLGELHPFKQYQGSKARFETRNETHVLDCFVHNISDFLVAAQTNNLRFVELKEWFDENEKTIVPRVLTMVFEKK